MKLHILSDLHLSSGTLEVRTNDADAVIAAGDIACPKETVAWLLGLRKPVFYEQLNARIREQFLKDSAKSK